MLCTNHKIFTVTPAASALTNSGRPDQRHDHLTYITVGRSATLL
jgi:hypothetical protein